MSDVIQSPNLNPETANPPASFLHLPSELRNTIYELLLLRLEPINPWHGDRHGLTTGLFRACKAVHHEATSLFYGQNRIDFTIANPEDLALFLKQIGSHNAGCIRDVLIEFPEFLCLEPGNVTLEKSSVSMLTTIQSSCANLSTLTTSLSSTNAMEHWLSDLDHFDVAIEALELVHTRFRAILPIQEIILEVYEEGDQLRKKMNEYEWKLSTTPYVEDDDSVDNFCGCSFHDSGDDFDDDFDDYEYDDYDIDNDSDFWRRAAD